MKHILRKHTMSGFDLLPAQDLPGTLIIEHMGSDKKYEFPLKWRAPGIAESEWKIPEDANLGQYEVTLASKSPQKKSSYSRYGSEDRWTSGNFRSRSFVCP